MQYQSEWFQLYCRAVLETDSYRVNDRIDAASRLIQEELSGTTIPGNERQDMEQCLRYLALLRRWEKKLAS
jgi:hypothetical protein